MRFTKKRIIIAIIGIVVLLAIVGNALSSAGSESEAISGATATRLSTASPTVAPTVQEPTPAPAVAPTAVPTQATEPTVAPTPTPQPEPIRITGRGQTATDPVTIPFLVAVLDIRHTGDSNFIVTAYQGDERELLVNEIGNYSGKRWLLAGEYVFDISADGAWEMSITALDLQESIAQEGFSGVGDEVSGWFEPPGTKAWEISHRGEDNFIVVAVCVGGNDLIVNEIGDFTGSSVIGFPEGPCFFDVTASGLFSIAPR